MYPIKQSTAITGSFFAHDSAGDAVTGMVDGGFTKRISKNGAAFGAMTVTITEMENGWYSFPLSSSHSDTIGLLDVTFINASCKQINLQWRVEARILDDLAFPNTSGRGTDVTVGGGVGIDWANVENQGTAVDLSSTDIQLVDTTTANTDMRGTENAFLASVGGALADVAADGDPTAVDTLMQYAKQLINVLVGTTGITAWAAGAAPANGVSLSEGLRAIFDDSNSLDGTKIPDILSLANINAEVDTALVDARVDEIVAATAAAVDPVIGSFMDQVLNKDGSQTFSQTTDSLEAVADSIPVAAPTAVVNAAAVWDRLLTGGTHNIADSAGRRVRDLQEFGVYEGGAVWIDTINGTAGTTDYESGTAFNPVDTIADANTIATSLGLTRFQVAPGSTIAFAAAQNGQTFIGHDWTLALGGQDIAGSQIFGATVSGIAAGTGTTQVFHGCIMNAASHIKNTHLIECGIADTQTVVEAGDFFFDRCHSSIAGTATWVFQFGALIGNTNLNMRNYSGGVQLEGMGDTGTDTASIEGRGQIIEGTCTGGSVAIRGNFTTSGITNLTLSDDARFDVDQVRDSVLDDATPFSGADIAAILTNTGEIGTAGAGLTAVSRAVNPQKNVALSDIKFLMVDSTNHNPAAGLTVTGERAIDGGAFSAVTGTIAEISDGIYQLDASQADMNGDMIMFRFSEGTSDDTFYFIKTAA